MSKRKDYQIERRRLRRSIKKSDAKYDNMRPYRRNWGGGKVK